MTLDELEKLLAAATPGEWTADSADVDNRDGLEHFIKVPHKSYIHLFQDSSPSKEEPWTEWTFNDHGEQAGKDAALIVAAVNALPSLIASARRVEGLEKAARALLDNLELSIAPAYGSKEHNAKTSRAVDDYGERVRDLEAALQPPTAKE